MPNTFEHFGGFLLAVVGHVFTLFAGCVVTVMIGLIERHFLKEKKLPKWLDAAVFLCFVFFACFQAWQVEYRAAATAQSKVDALTKPNLQVRLTSLYTAPAPKGVVAVVEAMIVNKGAQSIATDFTPYIVMNDGRVIYGNILMPPAAGTKLVLGFDGSPTEQSYEASDFLPRRAADQPIIMGGDADGFMEILFRDVTLDEINGKSSFHLTVKDFNGTPAEGERAIHRSIQPVIDPNVQGNPVGKGTP
jgi:hypothetical protein